jgi:hypothetical protein
VHCDCSYDDEEFEEHEDLLCPECWCNSTQNPDTELQMYWLDNDGDPDGDE